MRDKILFKIKNNLIKPIKLNHEPLKKIINNIFLL